MREIRQQAKLFRPEVPTYIDQLNVDHHEGFASFFERVQDATIEFVKKLHLGNFKSLDLYFSVLNQTFLALETELSYIGPDLYRLEKS